MMNNEKFPVLANVFFSKDDNFTEERTEEILNLLEESNIEVEMNYDLDTTSSILKSRNNISLNLF